MTCRHLRKQLFRVIIGDGRTQVCERCLDCHENPRQQAWVPRGEAKCPVDELPLLKDMRPKEAQPSLFAEKTP